MAQPGVRIVRSCSEVISQVQSDVAAAYQKIVETNVMYVVFLGSIPYVVLEVQLDPAQRSRHFIRAVGPALKVRFKAAT